MKLSLRFCLHLLIGAVIYSGLAGHRCADRNMVGDIPADGYGFSDIASGGGDGTGSMVILPACADIGGEAARLEDEVPGSLFINSSIQECQSKSRSPPA